MDTRRGRLQRPAQGVRGRPRDRHAHRGRAPRPLHVHRPLHPEPDDPRRRRHPPRRRHPRHPPRRRHRPRPPHPPPHDPAAPISGRPARPDARQRQPAQRRDRQDGVAEHGRGQRGRRLRDPGAQPGPVHRPGGRRGRPSSRAAARSCPDARTQGTCRREGRVTVCPIGNLRPGQSTTIHLKMRVTKPGTNSNFAAAGSATPDTAPDQQQGRGARPGPRRQARPSTTASASDPTTSSPARPEPSGARRVLSVRRRPSPARTRREILHVAGLALDLNQSRPA